MQLAGRTAVITGAAGGIGRALALALAARGAHLALVDRAEPALAATAALAAGHGGRVSTHLLDVGDRAGVAALPARLLARHPGIDVLINNAGVALAGSFEQTSDADIEWLFATNFWGVLHTTRALLPLLRRSDDARLVTVSSLYGLIAPAGHAAYAASKSAVRALSEALAAELAGSSVGVTVAFPGGVATGIVRHARGAAALPPDEDARVRREAARWLRLPPERAADAIVRAVERRRARVIVGRDARLLAWLQRAAPVGHARLLRRRMPRG